MSIQLFVGPSNCGKTFTMREWLLPALLAAPAQATKMAPAAGYAGMLIHDPPTHDHPEGQYPGPLYADVAEWRRAERRARVARFASPSLRALCSAAIEIGGLVVVLDEIDLLLGNARAPTPEAAELIERGRHKGCLLVGGCRRLRAVHTSVRSNLERAYFGNLADDDDRTEAAATANVRPELLRGITQQGTFLEWDRASGGTHLIRIENRRRMVLSKL